MKKTPRIKILIIVLISLYGIFYVIPLCIVSVIQMSFSIGYSEEARQTDAVFGVESWWTDENAEYYLHITPTNDHTQPDGTLFINSSKDSFAFSTSTFYGIEFITRIPVLYDTAGSASWEWNEETGTLTVTIYEMNENAYKYINGKKIVFSQTNAPPVLQK